MQKKPKVGLWSGLTAVSAVLTAAAMVATFVVAPMYETTINVATNASTYRIIKGETEEDTNYFTSSFASDEEREPSSRTKTPRCLWHPAPRSACSRAVLLT